MLGTVNPLVKQGSGAGRLLAVLLLLTWAGLVTGCATAGGDNNTTIGDQRMGPATEARGEGYHRLYVESEPSAAQLYIDEKLVGSTPAEIFVPFENPALGRTRGTIVLQIRKDGYVPEGIALFPTPAGYVSRSESGPGMRTLRVEMRRAQ